MRGNILRFQIKTMDGLAVSVKTAKGKMNSGGNFKMKEMFLKAEKSKTVTKNKKERTRQLEWFLFLLLSVVVTFLLL